MKPKIQLFLIALTLVIFAATILLARHQLRQKTRRQISQQTAEILHAVTLMQHLEGTDLEAVNLDRDVPSVQFLLLQKTSQMQNVIAARLYRPNGEFVATFPDHVREKNITPTDLVRLIHLERVSHFHEHGRLEEEFHHLVAGKDEAGSTVPLLEVLLPLHEPNGREVLGIAQFLIDGRSIAAEFAALDRNLNRQSILAILAAGGLMGVSLGWAFHRLQRSNRLLAQRTQDLLRANSELASG